MGMCQWAMDSACPCWLSWASLPDRGFQVAAVMSLLPPACVPASSAWWLWAGFPRTPSSGPIILPLTVAFDHQRRISDLLWHLHLFGARCPRTLLCAIFVAGLWLKWGNTFLLVTSYGTYGEMQVPLSNRVCQGAFQVRNNSRAMIALSCMSPVRC